MFVIVKCYILSYLQHPFFITSTFCCRSSSIFKLLELNIGLEEITACVKLDSFSHQI